MRSVTCLCAIFLKQETQKTCNRTLCTGMNMAFWDFKIILNGFKHSISLDMLKKKGLSHDIKDFSIRFNHLLFVPLWFHRFRFVKKTTTTFFEQRGGCENQERPVFRWEGH